MSETVTGLVVTFADATPIALRPSAAITLTVGDPLDLPDGDTCEDGAHNITVLPGVLEVYLEDGFDGPYSWAQWWLQRPAFLDDNYRMFRVSFSWPTDAMVIQSPEPDESAFVYTYITAGTVTDELSLSDIRAL